MSVRILPEDVELASLYLSAPDEHVTLIAKDITCANRQLCMKRHYANYVKISHVLALVIE